MKATKRRATEAAAAAKQKNEASQGPHPVARVLLSGQVAMQKAAEEAWQRAEARGHSRVRSGRFQEQKKAAAEALVQARRVAEAEVWLSLRLTA